MATRSMFCERCDKWVPSNKKGVCPMCKYYINYSDKHKNLKFNPFS